MTHLTRASTRSTSTWRLAGFTAVVASLAGLADLVTSAPAAHADGGTADRPLSPGIAPADLTQAASLTTPTGRDRALVLAGATRGRPDSPEASDPSDVSYLGPPVLVLERLSQGRGGRLALTSQRLLERLQVGAHVIASSSLEAVTDLATRQGRFTFKARSPHGLWTCTLAPDAPDARPLTANCQGRYLPLPASRFPGTPAALVAACERATADPSACLAEAQRLAVPVLQLAPVVLACDRATTTEAVLIDCLRALRGPDADGRDPGLLVALVDACRSATQSEAQTIACLQRSLSW